jgi:hypothetical protein
MVIPSCSQTAGLPAGPVWTRAITSRDHVDLHVEPVPLTRGTDGPLVSSADLDIQPVYSNGSQSAIGQSDSAMASFADRPRIGQLAAQFWPAKRAQLGHNGPRPAPSNGRRSDGFMLFLDRRVSNRSEDKPIGVLESRIVQFRFALPMTDSDDLSFDILKGNCHALCPCSARRPC